MTYTIKPRDTLPADISSEIENAQLLEYAMTCMRCLPTHLLPIAPPPFPRNTGDIDYQIGVLQNAWMSCVVMLFDDVTNAHERLMVESHPAFVLNRKWLQFEIDDIVKMKEPDTLDHKDHVAMIRYGGYYTGSNGLRGGGNYFLFTCEENKKKFEDYLGYKYPNWKESNMSLIERVKTEREAALRTKDYMKRSVLGQLFDKAEKEAKKSNREMTDDDIVSAAKKIIEGLGETRKFLIDAKAPREDERHQTLNTEEAILTPYVPKQMSEEELLTAVTAAKIEKNKGKVMAFFKANFLNQYDGATAAKAADAYIKIAAAPEPKTET